MKPDTYRFALPVLIAVQILFVTAYVFHEHTVYFWDHAMYHNMVRFLFSMFQEGAAKGWGIFHYSLSNDYNLIFGLPSFSAFLLFGDSRLVFILANFLVFFIAYELAVSFVLRRIFSFSYNKALLFGFGLCSLVPPLWIPLLEGYPDIGAAACVVFAFGIALEPKKNWQHALGMGALFALAVLLRRHFAYPALALFVASGVTDFISLFRKKSQHKRWSAFIRLGLFYGLCGIALVGFIGLIAPEFFLRMITIDYSSLYLSYKKPTVDFLVFTASNFGGGLLLLSLAGFVLAFRYSSANRLSLFLLAGTVFAWLATWCLGATQAGHHYMLHILPLLVITGLVGLFLSIKKRTGSQRLLTGGVMAFVLIANSAWALWFSPEGMLSDVDKKFRLYSAPRPPIVRPDYGALVGLAEYLEKTARPEDRILFVGSSFVFNQDIMRGVFTDILQRPALINQFLWAPEIDGVQDPPFNSFAAATIYVVPEPPQYHLAKEGQKIVTAAARQFPPPASSAVLFKTDAEIFTLANGTKVRIWRRKPWTPAALHESLDLIRETAGGQQGWVTSVMPAFITISTNAQSLTNAMVNFDASRPETTLFFDKELGEGNYRLGMDILAEPTCTNLTFALEAKTSSGRSLWQVFFEPPAVPGSLFRSFSIPPNIKEDAYLFLTFRANPSQPCGAMLQYLRVERS